MRWGYETKVTHGTDCTVAQPDVKATIGEWLKRGFSRVHEGVINELVKSGMKKTLFDKSVDAAGDAEFKELFTAIQNQPLMAPSPSRTGTELISSHPVVSSGRR